MWGTFLCFKVKRCSKLGIVGYNEIGWPSARNVSCILGTGLVSNGLKTKNCSGRERTIESITENLNHLERIDYWDMKDNGIKVFESKFIISFSTKKEMIFVSSSTACAL